MQILDARAEDRFAGQNETVDPVAGHIPGAHNRWFKRNFNDDGTFKSAEQLRVEFQAAGLDHKRVVNQCGSGVSAAANLLAMEHAGLEGARIYGGSWSEWIADPARPIATGPA
jgi:thiosulfate/3-mercaptopyruvate sulfurtransferase